MYSKLFNNLTNITDFESITQKRKNLLELLIHSIQKGVNENQVINLNFICTHNSRRSHFAQIWGQVASEFFKIPNVHCYSGGTQVTALHPKVIETLYNQGFDITKISNSENTIYAIKFDENALPIIGFSKKYDSTFNPKSNFIAVMNCSQVDEDCPFVFGSKEKFSIPYDDPGISDGTEKQHKIYEKTSLQIATEMFYVFSKIQH